MRFYAGAPLRTQDGFNIGVYVVLLFFLWYFIQNFRLSLVDDTPREEFSPRQRHTLKEFAVRLFFASRLSVVYQNLNIFAGNCNA